MTDFVQLQQDVFYALMSRKELSTVNVKIFRKMIIESEVNMKLLYLTQRGGKSGAGILVEMPTIAVEKPNVAGPVLAVDFSILVMEQPTINLSPAGGTLLSAEQIAVLVTETMHHLSLSTGVIVAGSNAIVPATEFSGVVAYRCHAKFNSLTPPMERAGQTRVERSGNTVTLSCSNADAEIRYTLDGTFPASGDGGNPQSKKYDEPFDAESGATVRACAYADGKIGSNVAALKIP